MFCVIPPPLSGTGGSWYGNPEGRGHWLLFLVSQPLFVSGNPCGKGADGRHEVPQRVWSGSSSVVGPSVETRFGGGWDLFLVLDPFMGVLHCFFSFGAMVER